MTNTRALVAALALAGVILAGCAAEDDDDASTPGDAPASGVDGDAGEVDDVVMAECTTDAAGMVARLDVVNDSSKRSAYRIDVVMEGAGGDQLATAFAFVDNLESGQSTRTDAHSLTTAPGGDFTCRLVSVDRTEAL